MKQKIYFIAFITGVLLLTSKMGFAQAKTVNGTVLDIDTKKPVMEIMVAEKGLMSNNTLTDSLGHFSLTLKRNSKSIVVNGVGYGKLEVPITSSDDLQINVKSNVSGLNDVVVIGYGQVKKITMTGAIASISGDEIRQSPTASLQNALSGRLPGLFSEQRGGRPGADAASIQIRGISTLNSANVSNAAGTNSYSAVSPLILVDDIETTIDQLQQIDPNEVESLTILKDASTTAVYGIRGSNGVIIIKTRRGRSGRPELTVRNEYGLQVPVALPKLNDPVTTLQLYKEYLLEQGLDPVASAPRYFAGNNLDYYKNNSDPYGHPYTDWWKTLMRGSSPQERINFDISGGSKKVRYFISLGYLSQGGIYKNFTKDQGYNGNFFFNRYNFRSNVDIDPTSTLHVTLDLSGRFGITNNPYETGILNGSSTFQRLWDGSINTFDYPIFNKNGSLGGMQNITGQLYWNNPVAVETYGGYQRQYDNNMNLGASAVQKLGFVTKGLSAKAMISYASDYVYEKDLNRTQIPLFYVDPITQAYVPVFTGLYRLPPLARSTFSRGTSQLFNVQAMLNYGRSFGDHNFSGLLLFNQNSNVYNTYSGSAVTPGIPTNYRGYAARISYNYASKYMLDLNAGYNGSDRFGNGKQYGLFPAVSAGWNIAGEPFFKNNVRFISLFKIRASYGLTGQDNIAGFQYLYQQTYSNNSSGGYNFGQTSTPVTSLVEGSLGNPNVTWEKKRTTDIGTDIQMFNGALSITADYFHMYSYDILLTRNSVPGTFGVGLPAVNLGKVANNGYDLQVNYKDNIGDFRFGIMGTVSYAKNKILFMDEPAMKYPWMAQTGHPTGGIYGYTWTGQYFSSVADIYNSPLEKTAVPMKNVFPGGLKLKDLNGDAILDQNDIGYIGTNLPSTTAGLSFNFSYKGFDVSCLFQGAFGAVVSLQRGLFAYFKPDRTSVPFNLGRWTPENANTATYPSLAPSITNGETSSFWFRKSDYVRFKNFEVGYTVPMIIAKKMHLKTIRIYANGYNMGLIYNALPVPMDPESANVALAGAGEYPQQRIFNFGFQVGL